MIKLSPDRDQRQATDCEQKSPTLVLHRSSRVPPGIASSIINCILEVSAFGIELKVQRVMDVWSETAVYMSYVRTSCLSCLRFLRGDS